VIASSLSPMVGGGGGGSNGGKGLIPNEGGETFQIKGGGKGGASGGGGGKAGLSQSLVTGANMASMGDGDGNGNNNNNTTTNANANSASKDKAGNNNAAGNDSKSEVGEEGGDGYSEVGSSQNSRGSDHASSRRYRKFLRIITTSDTVKYIQRFHRQTTMTTGFIAAFHIATFIVLVIRVNRQVYEVMQVSNGTKITGHSGYLLLCARAIDQILKGRGTPTLYNSSTLGYWVNMLTEESYLMREKLYGLYQSTLGINPGLFSYVSVTPYKEYEVVGFGVHTTTGNMSLLQMGNHMIMSALEIVQNYGYWTTTLDTNVSSTKDFQYLQMNGINFRAYLRVSMDFVFYGAQDNIQMTNKLHLAFLLVEGCGLMLFTFTYISYLLAAVAERRYRLYEVFMTVPVGLSKILALRILHQLDGNVDSEDDDDDEDDDNDNDGISTDPFGEGGGGIGADELAAMNAAAAEFDLDGFADPGHLLANSMTMAPSRTSTNQNSFNSGRSPLLQSSSSSNSSNNNNHSLQRRLASWFKSVLLVLRRNSITRGALKRSESFFDHTVTAVHFMIGKSTGITHSPSFSEATHRYFKRDSKVRFSVLWPFMIFAVSVVAFYGASYSFMASTVSLLANQNVMNYAEGRMLNSIAAAQELCASNSIADYPARIAVFQQALLKIKQIYYVLVEGSRSDITMGASAEVFPLVTRSIADDSLSLNELLYSSGDCIRINKSTCPNATWEYYQVSLMGVNTMITRLFSEFDQLIQEAQLNQTSVNISSPHLDYAFNVGLNDIFDGFWQMQTIHQNLLLKPYHNVITLHILLLAICLVGSVCFVLFVINPLNRKIKKEMQRIAELLSQLPRELDMTKVVNVAVNRMELQVYVPKALRRTQKASFLTSGGGGGGIKSRTKSGNSTTLRGSFEGLKNN